MEEASERLIKGPEGGGLMESAFSEDGSGAGPRQGQACLKTDECNR